MENLDIVFSNKENGNIVYKELVGIVPHLKEDVVINFIVDEDLGKNIKVFEEVVKRIDFVA